MGAAARAVTKSLRLICDYRTRGYSKRAKNIWTCELACGRGQITNFSRSISRCAARTRCPAFSNLAESLRSRTARGPFAGRAEFLRRGIACRGRSGPRLHHGGLLVLPALLRAKADGIYLRYR